MSGIMRSSARQTLCCKGKPQAEGSSAVSAGCVGRYDECCHVRARTDLGGTMLAVIRALTMHRLCGVHIPRNQTRIHVALQLSTSVHEKRSRASASAQLRCTPAAFEMTTSTTLPGMLWNSTPMLHMPHSPAILKRPASLLPSGTALTPPGLRVIRPDWPSQPPRCTIASPLYSSRRTRPSYCSRAPTSHYLSPPPPPRAAHASHAFDPQNIPKRSLHSPTIATLAHRWPRSSAAATRA